MKSYSQCGEDRWITENLVRPAKGVFCEVGAYDGVLSSNTLLFEEMGWDGILVEADPFLAAQCQRSRRAKTWCCAAGSICGLDSACGKFHVNESDRGLSGLSVFGKEIPVIIVPLSLILRNSGFDRVDLLSIDTEGTELDVWDSMGDYRPEIVIMEHQTCDSPSQIEPILKRMVLDGYKEVHRTQYNLIFTYQ